MDIPNAFLSMRKLHLKYFQVYILIMKDTQSFFSSDRDITFL